MIIDFRINCNNYKEKLLDNYSHFDYTCPKCGAKHSLIRHGNYERNLILVDNFDNVKEVKLLVLRLKCKSCGSTHAILPNDIIPYCIYSFSYTINVLTRRFVNGEKVMDICNNLSVSFQLVYFFISKFLEFMDSASFVLRNLENFSISTLYHFIESINTYNNSNNFSYQYFFLTRWIFLMSKFHNILSPPIYIGAVIV